MNKKQEWVNQLVLEEGITKTSNLTRKQISNWCLEYNDTFETDITEESLKRMLRKARWKNEKTMTKPNTPIVETNVNNVGNVLVIGDLHLPFTRKGYLEFCQEMYKKHKCKSVVFIGDLVDNHFSSFHDTDPDADYTGGQELVKVIEEVKKWYKAFPKARVCNGNHDLIPQRKLFNAGVSKQWLKPMSEVLDTPNWEYATEFTLDGVLYTHGTGRKARQRVRQDLQSVVQGHYHSESYIEHFVGRAYKIFACQIGSGIDDKSYAFAYGRAFAKCHINCSIIKENGTLPIIEYMNLNKNYLNEV